MVQNIKDTLSTEFKRVTDCLLKGMVMFTRVNSRETRPMDSEFIGRSSLTRRLASWRFLVVLRVSGLRTGSTVMVTSSGLRVLSMLVCTLMAERRALACTGGLMAMYLRVIGVVTKSVVIWGTTRVIMSGLMGRLILVSGGITKFMDREPING